MDAASPSNPPSGPPSARVRVERLVAGGDGLARLDDGRVAFVHGGLPGELVDVEVTATRSDFVRATATAVVERSAHRIEPPCAHRLEGCGGCGWMHLAPAAQFDAKVEIVRESLRRTGRFAPDLVDAVVAPGGAVAPSAARTTIRVVGGADRRVGFREEGSDRVVPIRGCLVAHPRLSELLADLRVDPGVEVTLRTSVATGAVTARWEWPRRRRRPGGGQRPLDGLPRSVHVGPRAHLVERVAGVDLRVSAGSFFQSGPAAAELLIATVERLAPEAAGASHALDAYGGVGLFAATVLASAGRLTLVESARSSVDDAVHNLRSHAAAEVVGSEVGAWEPPDEPVDVVVADPARSGLGKPGVRALTAARPEVLVLVSCDPVSLARDARLLHESGYRPRNVEVLDLFPHTPHVETVTRFTPAHPGESAAMSSGETS